MKKKLVEIIISRGAVQDVIAPDGIKVIIKDYDVLKDDGVDGFDIREDIDGYSYQYMEF